MTLSEKVQAAGYLSHLNNQRLPTPKNMEPQKKLEIELMDS
jgi:hypothetical protein